MDNKKLVRLLGGVLSLLLLHSLAAAQTGALRGRVLLKTSDGTLVPVAGAAIDVFRTDLAGRFIATTGRDGFFVFAGLPLVGTYIVAASAPNAKPQVIADVKVGREIQYELILEPGDGRRLTKNVARFLSKVPKPGETENELIDRKFREGNDALRMRKFDQAIKAYDEILVPATAEPQVLCTFLTNKSAALNQRAREAYSRATKTADVAAKSTKMDSAFRDFREAAEVASRAVEIISGLSLPEDESARRTQETTKVGAFRARADAFYDLVTKVDTAQVLTGLVAFQEYIEVEDDPNQKSKAETDAARMLLQAKQTKSAIEQYRRLLIADPENREAIFGYGFSLYQSGERERFPEAAQYLRAFLERAPSDDPLRREAAEALNKIKAP